MIRRASWLIEASCPVATLYTWPSAFGESAANKVASGLVLTVNVTPTSGTDYASKAVTPTLNTKAKIQLKIVPLRLQTPVTL